MIGNTWRRVCAEHYSVIDGREGTWRGGLACGRVGGAEVAPEGGVSVASPALPFSKPDRGLQAETVLRASFLFRPRAHVTPPPASPLAPFACPLRRSAAARPGLTPRSTP